MLECNIFGNCRKRVNPNSPYHGTHYQDSPQKYGDRKSTVRNVLHLFYRQQNIDRLKRSIAIKCKRMNIHSMLVKYVVVLFVMTYALVKLEKKIQLDQLPRSNINWTKESPKMVSQIYNLCQFQFNHIQNPLIYILDIYVINYIMHSS